MNKSSAIKQAISLARTNGKSYVVIREDGEYGVISYMGWVNGTYSDSSFVVLADSNGTLDYCGE